MDAEIFIALINPAMLAVFGSAFFLLWRHQPKHRYILDLSLGMGAVAGGFLFQYFTPFGFAFARILSNMLFIAGGVAVVSAVLRRYRRRPPHTLLLSLAGSGFAIFLWYMFVVPDLTSRILTANFTFGAVTLVLAHELRQVRDRRLIDDILLGSTVLFGASFFIRPLATLWIEGPYTTYDELYQTIYWITLTFCASLFLLIFALGTITAIALDVIDDLRRESNTDPLSGLLNRRGFEEAAGAAIRDCRRKGLPVSLVVCDLDNFKRINDNHGHASGDTAIIAAAECLLRGARGDRSVSRLGGEEFAILVEGATAQMARLFAESLRVAIATTVVPRLPADLRLSGSFGVAELGDGEGLDELLDRADQALYQAKETGRDRVCVHWSAAPPTPVASGLRQAGQAATPF